MDANKPTGETMSEGSDIPPNPPMQKSSAMAEVCVPLKSLAMPGQDDQMNNPEMGDTVEFHAQGKVARIEGDNAYVSLETVNGEPVTAEASKVNDTAAPDEYADLQQQAAGRMM